jgi:UDP-N-acetylmuramoyl-L-alanyl-D-glutamate--2,6-diaminopimelate ligase
MISLLRKHTPYPLLRLYHYCLSRFAAFLFGFPSRKLITIGVTGTTGKSTTVYLLFKILEAAGYTVGATSTAIFKIGKWEELNDTKMTMVGRFALQKLIKKMLKNRCDYAIIETTSQGIEQYRHAGINYDLVLFTNLTPEHIEAHGGFENYRNAKGKLFTHLGSCPEKTINGKRIEKQIVVNLDDPHADFFLSLSGKAKKWGYSTNGPENTENVDERVSMKLSTEDNIHFTLQTRAVTLPLKLLGAHNANNALAAAVVARTQNISWEKIGDGLQSIESVPGRLEMIPNQRGLSIIVDYAHEPIGLRKLYEVVKAMSHGRIIHVLGSTGGGRDVAKRPILGEIAGKNADIVIVTNEDPYDDDQKTIIDQVASGSEKAGKIPEKNLKRIQDRREAIHHALSLGVPGDIILITGKGCEQAIVVKNRKKIPWDDRKVIHEELEKSESLAESDSEIKALTNNLST